MVWREPDAAHLSISRRPARGGASPRRRGTDSPRSGAVCVYDVSTGAELGSYKVPRAETGNCTMHNFNFVPGIEKDLLVSSAYTAGTTVADLTDPANPVEIASTGPATRSRPTPGRATGTTATSTPTTSPAAWTSSPSTTRRWPVAATLPDNPQTQERLFP